MFGEIDQPNIIEIPINNNNEILTRDMFASEIVWRRSVNVRKDDIIKNDTNELNSKIEENEEFIADDILFK